MDAPLKYIYNLHDGFVWRRESPSSMILITLSLSLGNRRLCATSVEPVENSPIRCWWSHWTVANSGAWFISRNGWPNSMLGRVTLIHFAGLFSQRFFCFRWRCLRFVQSIEDGLACFGCRDFRIAFVWQWVGLETIEYCHRLVFFLGKSKKWFCTERNFVSVISFTFLTAG